MVMIVSTLEARSRIAETTAVPAFSAMVAVSSDSATSGVASSSSIVSV